MRISDHVPRTLPLLMIDESELRVPLLQFLIAETLVRIARTLNGENHSVTELVCPLDNLLHQMSSVSFTFDFSSNVVQEPKSFVNFLDCCRGRQTSERESLKVDHPTFAFAAMMAISDAVSSTRLRI